MTVGMGGAEVVREIGLGTNKLQQQLIQ